MPDIEHGLKWWIRYVIVPLIGGGGAIAIVVAIINRPPQTAARVVRGPDYNEANTPNPETRQREDTAHKKGSNPVQRHVLAEPATPEPSSTLVSQTGNPIPSATPPKQLPSEPAEAGVLVAESYKLKADSIRKVGDYATISLTLEALAEKPIRFVMWSVSVRPTHLFEECNLC